jgi:hypothetical protein
MKGLKQCFLLHCHLVCTIEIPCVVTIWVKAIGQLHSDQDIEHLSLCEGETNLKQSHRGCNYVHRLVHVLNKLVVVFSCQPSFFLEKVLK